VKAYIESAGVRARMEADFDVQAPVCIDRGPFAVQGRHCGTGNERMITYQKIGLSKELGVFT
jgi:hypothetical protein